MNMTRREAFKNFIGGVAGLGALISGKRTKVSATTAEYLQTESNPEVIEEYVGRVSFFRGYSKQTDALSIMNGTAPKIIFSGKDNAPIHY